MKKVERYVMKTVLQSIMLILSLLLVLQIFILFVNQMGDMGKGNYHLPVVLEFIGLRLPYELSMSFPVICLVGCLIGLSVLANHSELVILRASGMSIADVIRIVAIAGIGLVLVVMLLSELFIPKLMFKANTIKLEALNQGQMLRQSQALWFRNKQNFWYVSLVANPRHLEDITVFRKNAEGILESMEHFPVLNWENHQWFAKSGEKSIFRQAKMYRESVESHYLSDLPLSPGFFKHIEQTPDEMRLIDLWQRIKQLKREQDIAKEELIFWQRLFEPFNTLLMMLLAIPCIFGPLRSSTMGAKLIVGIALGFGFYILNQMFGFMSQVYQMPPLIGASLPLILFAFIGLFLLKKTY